MLFRRFLIVVTFVGSFTLLAYSAHPGRGLFTGVALLGLSLLAALVQGVSALLSLLSPRLRVHRRFVGVLLLVWLLAAGAATSLIPLGTRVLLSEPWLRTEANALAAGASTRHTPFFSGLFRFEGAGLHSGVAHFSTGSYGLFGDAGLAYAPSGLPASRDRVEPTYEHLYGPWWRYSLVDD